MDPTHSEECSELPSYLHAPPQSRCNPPLLTRVQELPLGHLTWEDFERLCLRLARLEADVIYCQLYGTRGQNQEGIDLYAATRTSQKYRVYQCKRQQDFGPAKIKAAVTKFLGGKWVGRTEALVLCTKESLAETKRANEVVAQREILATLGIHFEPWDSQQLNLKLKDHPRLVDDFFGRGWVEAFCGAEAARSLGNRLDAGEVADLRRQLGLFYARVFEKHDPGIPVPENVTTLSLPLADRYVVPDVLEHRAGLRPSAPAEQEEEVGTGTPADDANPLPQPGATYEERVGVGEWLSSGHNFLLLGVPGGGKSSLLRFLALDLLGESPLMGSVARLWGSRLPVWVSFPQWTRLIEGEGQTPCSLQRLLRLWLRGWNEERLWPLVEKALEDDRLLLLVDGLDEWSSQTAAQIALNRLRVFVEQRNIPSVAVSRPHGFQRLGVRPADWKIARLAGFSRGQQRELALCWFRFRELARIGAQGADAERRASAEADALMEELGRSPGLGTLAHTPLLLSLLIYHRMHHVRLPQTRFRAYESLVEHLISVHPQRRLAAASDAGEKAGLSGDEIRQALALLAFRIQVQSGEGLVEADEGGREVEKFLQDAELGLGLAQGEARKTARQIVEVGESSLGLLVRKSPTGIGFLHRTFQEFLAAAHLARLPLEQQAGLVEQHCSDPRWREVILGLLYCNRRPFEVRALVDRVRGKKQAAAALERLALESLLAEVAFSDFNCPAGLAQELASETFQVIETGPRMSHREVLLSHALGGLAFAKVRDLVRAKIRSWFPCWSRYRAGIFEAMSRWPAETEVVECLWRAMHDEEPSNQRAGARTLARLGGEDIGLGRRVATLAWGAEAPNVRAVAVDALVCGWPMLNETRPGLDAARQSGDAAVRLAAIGGRVILRCHNNADRDELLRLGSLRSGIGHTWQEDIPPMLLEGWPGDAEVKRACIDSLLPPSHERTGIDPEVAWPTLLAGFARDADVADLIRIGLDRDDLFSGVLWSPQCWEMLAGPVSENEALAASLNRWFTKQNPGSAEFFHAATLVRTPGARARVLEEMKSGVPHWAATALLDGWGLQDSEVAARFRELLDGPPSGLSHLAHLLPRMVPDATDCRARLLALLRDPEYPHPNLALAGLHQLQGQRPDTEVVDIVVGQVLHRPNLFWMDRDGCVRLLIEEHHRDPRGRELAKQQFAYDFPPYSAIAAAFPDDREIRGLLIERLTPLPDRLRLVIAEWLPQESPDSAFCLGLLGLYDREQDEQVKCQASLSYWGMVKAAGPVGDAHLERLGRDIVRYGPDLREQRQAAFCGLATVRRLDILADAKETIGEERICAIGTLTRRGKRNAPLLRCMLENWGEVKRTFGDEACLRLNDRRTDWMQMWEHLAPFSDVYPVARQDLLGLLAERSERTVGHDTLLFLGRTMPGSRLLLEYCLKALRIGEAGADVGGPTALVAAELLGANFRGDPEVLNAIRSGQEGQHLYQKTILCLCEGWEKTEVIARAYDFVVHNHWPLPPVIWHRLLCRKGTSEEVSKEILSLINSSGSPRGLSGSLVLRPFARRLTEDEALAERLHRQLRATPSCSEKASLSRLLAEGRGLGEELRSWCVAELGRQQAARSPELGFDWLAGRVRAVSQSLLDVLEPGAAEEGELPQ